MSLRNLNIFLLLLVTSTSGISQSLIDEFIYEEAPFPECHASTLALTTDGVASAWFGGTEEKNNDVEIWVSLRDNEGWSEPESVAHGIQSDGSRFPCWNPVLFQMPDGPLLLFYKVGPNPEEWWGEMKRSSDGGRTWSPREILPNGGIGPVKNKPILLPDGSLLCSASTEHNGWRVHFEITRDAGKTWDVFPAINDGSKYNIIQPSVLVHGDKLQILARSKEGSVVSSWSNDMGKSWSAPAPSDLPNPNSGTDALTLADGRHLIIYNHTTTTPGRWGGPRSPLNLAISKDGITWQALAVLEDTEGEYSYPAIVQAPDGKIHLTYTWKRKKVKYRVIDINELSTATIEDGVWPESITMLD